MAQLPLLTIQVSYAAMQGIGIPHCHHCLTGRADDSEVESAATRLCFLGPGEIQLLAKEFE